MAPTDNSKWAVLKEIALVRFPEVADAMRRLICPKCIYFPEHFCYCFSSKLCVLNTTNTD
jgi:hypothetical protein